jgi:hypothetical protein
MLKAQLELDDAKKFKLPSLQQEYFAVQPQQQVQAPPPRDEKLENWQVDNPWFGQDEEMTAAAYGVHERLKKQGVELGSDEYYAELDKTMRKRFAENFDEDDAGHQAVEARRKADSPKTKPSTVVASASRSTAPKRVRLTTSQVAIVKKLGITPEQYVKEFLKVEA